MVERRAAETAPRDATPPMSWRRLLVRAFVLPALLGLPLLGVGMFDDDRFDIFHWGAEYASRPVGIVADQLRETSFHLNQHGNFRPVGRMLERTQDTVVFLVTETFAVPANLALRLWFAATLGLVGVVLCLFVSTLVSPLRVLERPPPREALLVPLAFAPLLVASGQGSPVVMFTDIYLQTMVLVLLVAMLAARRAHFEEAVPRRREYAIAVVLGLLLAAFNEPAAAAIPVSIAAVVARGRWALGYGWVHVRRTQAWRLTIAGVAGFVLVFVPVRVYLSWHCARASCYSPSDLVITSSSPSILLRRAVSWLPPFGWSVAAEPASAPWFVPAGVGAVAVAMVLAGISISLVRSASRGEPAGSQLPLLSVGALLVLLGAAVGASSGYMQLPWWQTGTGWRDTAILVVGGAVLLTGVFGSVLRRGSPERGWVPLWTFGSVLVLATVVSWQANHSWSEGVKDDRESRLVNEMALSLVDFDPAVSGEARRCALLADFLEPYESGDYAERRIAVALDRSSERLHDMGYCGSSDG
jgi:hypothetical protein